MAELTADQKRVAKKVIKKPRKAGEIAGLLGLPSHHGVTRHLSALEQAGVVTKTDKGYVKS